MLKLAYQKNIYSRLTYIIILRFVNSRFQRSWIKWAFCFVPTQ